MLPGPKASQHARLSADCHDYARGMAVTTTRRSIIRLRDATGPTRTPDDLAVEAPLVLGLDGEAIATLMRTPGHDLELAAGWLVVESGVRAPGDIVTLRSCREDDTDRVHITL